MRYKLKYFKYLVLCLILAPSLSEAATVKWKEAYSGVEPGAPTSRTTGLNFSTAQKAEPGRTYYYFGTGAAN